MGFVEPYHLAIDVGTSRVAAAVSRLGADGRIHTLPVALGRRGDTVSTVVFVAEDGSLLFGDAADRRGVTQPERLVREFKRSIGDDVPFVVEGHVVTPERLYAETVASIVDAVADREGLPAEGVVLTHPVAWGEHRLGLIRDALVAVDLGGVGLMTEPEAAARHYEAGRPLDEGQAVAVYDLGGGTFDAVVLRRGPGGAFGIVGRPAGIGNLGGADFDDMVLRHAIGMAEVEPEHLTVERDDARLALAQLRRECVDAKEALSYDSDVTIPVLLPSGSPSVRLTRAEFETMIDDDIARTVDALDDALDSAGIAPEDLDCVLLIGGSSRIPLVTQRLSERFDRPLAIDADPKSSIALGAARTGLVRTTDRALGVDDAPLVLMQTTDDAAVVDASAPAGTTAAPVGVTAHDEVAPRMSRPHLLALAGGTLVFIAAVLFSTSEAAGLLPQQTVVEAEASGSGLTYELPPYAPTATAPSGTQPISPPPVALQPVADVQDGTADQAAVDAGTRPKAPASRSTTNSSASRADGDSSGSAPRNPKAADPTPSGPSSGSSSPAVAAGATEIGNGTGATQPTASSPSPSPTQDPTPEPTQDPAPEPTQEPSTPPSEEPAPEPTQDPAPEPAQDPSSEPSPEATGE